MFAHPALSTTSAHQLRLVNAGLKPEYFLYPHRFFRSNIYRMGLDIAYNGAC